MVLIDIPQHRHIFNTQQDRDCVLSYGRPAVPTSFTGTPDCSNTSKKARLASVSSHFFQTRSSLSAALFCSPAMATVSVLVSSADGATRATLARKASAKVSGCFAVSDAPMTA